MGWIVGIGIAGFFDWLMEAQATMRADQLLEDGDLDGSLVWHAIITAIRRLQAMAPIEGEGCTEAATAK